MKILIANDGSEFGRSAVDFAANIIDPNRETQVKIITVVEPAATIEVETIIESVEELADPKNLEAQRANDIAERSAKLLREKFDGAKIRISHEIIGGLAARTIVEKAEEWQADLIAVGSHGYGFWKKAWRGSVSTLVADHAKCSVLIVRRDKD